jgi:hypothetical protein
VRGILTVGAVVAFVVAVLGLTREALALVGILYVLEKAEAKK